MKQKHERKVTRFLITMAVALLVGGICGYLGAMYASSFSGVLAGLGTVLGYSAPVLAALAVCIGCLMARRAYQKAQRLSQSGSDEDVLAALDTLDACIIALETQSMVSLCFIPFAVALAPRAPLVPLASAAVLLVSLFLGAFSQRRVIELVKCLCPEKRGDTMDKNFTREWYESCDEAERARIGFAAYKSFLWPPLWCSSFSASPHRLAGLPLPQWARCGLCRSLPILRMPAKGRKSDLAAGEEALPSACPQQALPKGA